MRLAKNVIDVGLFTNRPEPLLAFWQRQLELPLEELLPVSSGVRQYRLGLEGSVVKLNAVREPLPVAPPSGYRQLLIAREGVAEPLSMHDLAGNQVLLVPPGYEDITGIGMRLAVRDTSAFHDFYGRVLEAQPVGPSSYRLGKSVLLFTQLPDAVRTETLRAPGYRYLTVQVFDVDAEYRALLARGAEDGRSPSTLGATARIAFIRDPDGNWIEISQRASLTGPLPG